VTDAAPHTRIALTSLVVLGAAIWLAAVFVTFDMPPVVLGLIGAAGGAGGARLARRLRDDLRPGEAALAAAIAVALLVGVTAVYREQELSRAEILSVAGAAAMAALFAWLVALGDPREPGWSSRVLACGAVSSAFLFIGGAALAWLFRIDTGSPSLELTAALMVPMLAGVVAAMIVPDGNVAAIFGGQWLVMVTAALGVAIQRDATMAQLAGVALVSVPVGATLTIPGIIGGAVGMAILARRRARGAPIGSLPAARVTGTGSATRDSRRDP
jgi:hypothetical protein